MSNDEINLSPIGRQRAVALLERIASIRAEHHCCTVREVARLEKLAITVAHRRIQRLREMGLVDWTLLTGSLHITEAGVEFYIGSATSNVLTGTPIAMTEQALADGAQPDVMDVIVPAKKAAPKKTAPKKKVAPKKAVAATA